MREPDTVSSFETDRTAVAGEAGERTVEAAVKVPEIIKRQAERLSKVARTAGRVAARTCVQLAAPFKKAGESVYRHTETISREGGEEPEATEPDNSESEEVIEEDTEESVATLPETGNPIKDYLRGRGVDEPRVTEASMILSSNLDELVDWHLSNIGVKEEQRGIVAQLLVPAELYLKRLEELGLPANKAEEAHNFLVGETGRLRLKHLTGLVGGREEEIRELMHSHHQDLLAEELRELGLDDEKIGEISAVPRRKKELLVEIALRKLGLEDEVVEGARMTAAIMEVPPAVAEKASRLGLPLETLVRAREAFNKADWEDTYDYLELATKHEGARELLREHSIEIEAVAPVETPEEKASRLSNMTLKEINESDPDEWEAERSRRMARQKEELAGMLNKFRAYIPLDELPLPPDIDVPPEVQIPNDPLGAYGLWRRLLTDSYIRRISNPDQYKSVRAELHRVGGPIPFWRKIKQRQIAIRVLKRQKQDARRTGQRGNFGWLGVGYTKYKQNFRSVENAYIEAQDARRALDIFHKQNFISDGQATPRKRLAESIVKVRLREIALREGKLDLDPPHMQKAFQHETHGDEGMV